MACRAAKELGDERWGIEFLRCFFDGVSRPSAQDISTDIESYIDLLLELVATAKALKAGHLFQHHLGEVFEQMIHQSHLLEAIDKYPGASLAWFQLAQEIVGSNFVRDRADSIVEFLARPNTLVKLAEKEPEAAVAWVRLARQTGVWKHFAQRAEEILNSILSPDHRDFADSPLLPRRMLLIASRRPSAAHAWIDIVRENCD